MNAPSELRSPIDHIRGYHAELTGIRRDLHAHPELSFQENRTSSIVAAYLKKLGIETHTGLAKTGVVGVIRGNKNLSGRAVGLRADMDCLPMHESNHFEYKSKHEGRMHACGHDGHTTMLLGAAQYLASTRNFDGSAFLIFQPGEEGFAGARTMIEDGLFERFPANEVYALHNWPGLPAGHIGLNPGPMMAAADRIEITICGRGGHAAHPHLSVDPVLIAGHIITAVQSIVARNVAPIDTAVVSLCAIQAGHPGAFSVIPREARIIGTVRAFQHSIQTMVEQRLNDIVHATAKAFGGEATLKYERVYPATINHAPQYDHALHVAEDLIGRDHVIRQMPPSMGAEDFSFMLQAKPGCYARLGQGMGEGSCFLHNSRYDFNDAIIPLGAGFLAALAERRMPLAA